ncbi:hypothetical protein, partial [Streptomyces sp. NPDC127092]|uniref:hypothetical protein n=1 Tax=Streptomyces sp. NPDC127092 TaxID=3347135 RepID=UPI003654E8F0
HDFSPPARRRGPVGSGTPTGPHGAAGWADTGRVQHFLADHEFAVTAVMSGLIVTLAVAAIWSIFPCRVTSSTRDREREQFA